MLPKASLLLLGIVNQAEVNAYELIKVLEKMNVRNWFKIADSTVYATLKKLEKSELIKGNLVKDNNMPEKVCYRITLKGENILNTNIKNIISEFSYDTNYFSIASFFIIILEKDIIIKLLKKRCEVLDKYKIGINQQLDSVKKKGLNPIYLCNIIRNKMIIENEINITKIYLKEITNYE